MLKLLKDTSADAPASHSEYQVKHRTLPLLLEGFLRREELAQHFGVSPRTVARWETLRKGPPRVCVGRTILYNVESVREWLRSREEHLAVSNKHPRRVH